MVTDHRSRSRHRCESIAVHLLLLLIALPIPNTELTGQTWQPLGPRPTTGGQVENIRDGEVTGALNVVLPHPTDSSTLYVGAVNGGIWKTTEAFAVRPRWVPIFENAESLSIGAMAFDAADSTHRTLVAGVGRTSSGYYGGGRTGVFRSTDAGLSWTALGGRGLNVRGIAAWGDTIVVAADSADDPTAVGLWRTSDDGATWTRISEAATGLPAGPSFDLAVDPIRPSRLFTHAGGRGIYRSEDVGGAWTKVSDARVDAVLAAATNVRLAVGARHEVYVGIVWTSAAGSRLEGLFRFANGSGPWVALDLPDTREDGHALGVHPAGQGNRHFSLVADPADSMIVYVGGDRQPHFTERSRRSCPHDPAARSCFPNSIGARDFTGRLFRVDARRARGAQYTPLTHAHTASWSAPHADSRDMAFAANGDLLEVDDGGIYRRTNPRRDTGDWLSVIGNLAVTEFLNVAWDANADAGVGGAQDTGAPEQPAAGQGRWLTVHSGDGGDVVVDDRSPSGLSIRYSSSQGLQGFERAEYDRGTFLGRVEPGLESTVHGDTMSRWSFITPIVVNNVEAERLVFGAYNGVYESLDRGDSVTPIEPRLRVNDAGGRPLAYGARRSPDVLYVARGSTLFVREALGDSLLPVASDPGFLDIAVVEMDPDDPRRVFVVDTAAVFETRDGGSSWNDLTENLAHLDPGRLLSLAYRRLGRGMVIVGAARGVFSRDARSGIWTQLGSGLPRVPVYELEYDADDDLLLAGTFGRGAWVHFFGTPRVPREY